MSQFDEETTRQANLFADALERLVKAQESLSATAGAIPAPLPVVNAPPGSPVTYVNGRPVQAPTDAPPGSPVTYVNGRPVQATAAPPLLREGPRGGDAADSGQNSRTVYQPPVLAAPVPPMYNVVNGQLQTALAEQLKALKRINDTLSRDNGIDFRRVKGWK